MGDLGFTPHKPRNDSSLFALRIVSCCFLWFDRYLRCRFYSSPTIRRFSSLLPAAVFSSLSPSTMIRSGLIDPIFAAPRLTPRKVAWNYLVQLFLSWSDLEVVLDARNQGNVTKVVAFFFSFLSPLSRSHVMDRWSFDRVLFPIEGLYLWVISLEMRS